MGAKAAIICVCVWHMSSMSIQRWWENEQNLNDKQGPTKTLGLYNPVRNTITPCRSTLQEPLLTHYAAMANEKHTHSHTLV